MCRSFRGIYGDRKGVKGALWRRYPGKKPDKGVDKRGPTDLAYGPMAQVISLITGAAGNTGFKGLGRVGGRQNKLVFDDKDFQFNTFIFQREDTGKSVKVTYSPQVLPQNPDMGELMPLVVSGKASKEERDRFVSMWQGNVKKVLLEPDKYPGLFEIEEVKI